MTIRENIHQLNDTLPDDRLTDVREYLADLRRAHAEGGFPTVDDPARTA